MANCGMGFHCFRSDEYFVAVVAVVNMLSGIVLVESFIAVESPTIAVVANILFVACIVMITYIMLACTIDVALVTFPSLSMTNIAAMLVRSERVDEADFAIVTPV
jgi:hypothetical protein